MAPKFIFWNALATNGALPESFASGLTASGNPESFCHIIVNPITSFKPLTQWKARLFLCSLGDRIGGTEGLRETSSLPKSKTSKKHVPSLPSNVVVLPEVMHDGIVYCLKFLNVLLGDSLLELIQSRNLHDNATRYLGTHEVQFAAFANHLNDNWILLLAHVGDF